MGEALKDSKSCMKTAFIPLINVLALIDFHNLFKSDSMVTRMVLTTDEEGRILFRVLMSDGNYKTVMELIKDQMNDDGEFDEKLFNLHYSNPLFQYYFNNKGDPLDFLHFSVKEANFAHSKMENYES